MQLFISGFEIEERIENDSEGLEQGEYANGSSVKRNGGISLRGTWTGKVMSSVGINLKCE